MHIKPGFATIFDYTAPDLHTIFQSGSVFGHRSSSGRIVSSAAIFPYENTLASIGMVIVHPDCRGLGLAKDVMRRCMESVPSGTALILIATQQGVPLYERLGFTPAAAVRKLICEKYVPLLLGFAKKMSIITGDSQSFYNELVELDAYAVGDKRTRFLQARLEQAEESAVLLDSNHKVRGFGMRIRQPGMAVIGPVVAPNAEMAMAIIDNLATNQTGRIRIDIPEKEAYLLSLLEERGFNQVAHPPVMLAGAASLPERSGTLFAIAAQAFG